MLSILIALCLSTADTDFAPRIEALKREWTDLNRIAVEEDAAIERAMKLVELYLDIDKGVESNQEFERLYLKMEAVRIWLWDSALERPALPQGAFSESADNWIVETPGLRLTLARDDLAMTAQTGGHTWRFLPCADDDVQLMDGAKFSLLSAAAREANPFITGYSVGMTLKLSEFSAAPGLTLYTTFNVIGRELVIEIAPHENGQGVRLLNWPKALETEAIPDTISVIPLMQGILLPGDWPTTLDRSEACDSRWIYMPWWGQIRGGAGVQTILESRFDAGAHYQHPAGGPTRIQPQWRASLGKLAYARVVRYVFSDNASYVTMAKRYRRYVQETGRFVSLAEKRAATPALDEVIGKPVVHIGAMYQFMSSSEQFFNRERPEQNHAFQSFDQILAQLQQLKQSGIEDAYVHLDGWGFYGYDNGHPDVLPPGYEQGGWEGLRRLASDLDDMGYFLAFHDQYRDFYKNAVSFGDHLRVMNVDGSMPEHSLWCGGPHGILSPWFAPGYVRRNYDALLGAGIKVKGAYLDVFSVVPMEESAQPAQPMTRADCARLRGECFEILRARGFVVSSEEPVDTFIRTLHLVHHGPYATKANSSYLDEPIGIRVPLLNLVYHDSIMLPWEMSDDGGWGIPQGDAGWLHCLLNAGLPYVYPGASPEQIERVNTAAKLAAACAHAEMLTHEFLDESRRKQRATYSNGAIVTVDFDAKTYAIEGLDR